MKTVNYNGKDYRVQDNGLIHVLENNRSGLGWKVLNRKTRLIEHIRVTKLSHNVE